MVKELAASQWLLECWEILVDRVTGCEVLVVAAGDQTDRLIGEAAALAGVRATMCDLSSLTLPPASIGAMTVYVGPSSFAVDTARKLYAQSMPDNGAELHRRYFLVRVLPFPTHTSLSAQCDDPRRHAVV